MHPLEKIFSAAIRAVQPSALMPKVLSLHNDRLQLGEEVVPLNTFRNIYVAGAGKAAASMAYEAELILNDLIVDGMVAIKDPSPFPLKTIRPFVAGHPIPTVNSVLAAEEIIKLVSGTDKNDLLIFLLSGGASSLITDLPPLCTLPDIHAASRLLINCGASIQEINTVRKHLSVIKGGGLARLCNAELVTFIISDVVGNELSVIGSGPTVPDTTSFTDALDILTRYNLYSKFPIGIVDHLRKGANTMVAETPYPGDASLKKCRNYLIGDIDLALKAAATEARNLGYDTIVQEELLEGDAECAARKWVESISSVDVKGRTCFIAGGETTVRVTGSGKGGRNQHFALAAAIAMKDKQDIALLAAGTDGSDGPTDAAGAIVTPETFRNAVRKNLSPAEYLHNNDAYHFFTNCGGLLKTGPTHTNVMDVVIAIREPGGNPPAGIPSV